MKQKQLSKYVKDNELAGRKPLYDITKHKRKRKRKPLCESLQFENKIVV